jgi:hypothetical protein
LWLGLLFIVLIIALALLFGKALSAEGEAQGFEVGHTMKWVSIIG